jgi:hypothetical protein
VFEAEDECSRQDERSRQGRTSVDAGRVTQRTSVRGRRFIDSTTAVLQRLFEF